MTEEKNMTLIACPVKRTMTQKWVCTEKCTYTQAQCLEKMQAMQLEAKYCIDCADNVAEQECEACMGVEGGRERPNWKLPVGTMRKSSPESGPEQMSLF